jgi:N utilization substance protein B
MGARRRARILALQALYAWETHPGDLDLLVDLPWLEDEKKEKISPDALAFARHIITGTLEQIEVIDKKIADHLDHWDFGRLAKVDLAILRISAYCLIFQKDIPFTVTIDEAIDIAKEFGSDDSYRFVNGVLDGIRKSENNV